MSGVTIHPEKGVNPFLTYCPRCKGEAPEIVLVGADDGIYQCDAGLSEGGPHRMVGRPRPTMDSGDCQQCGHLARWSRVGTLKEGQRIQATQPCDACLKELAEWKEVVEAGGVYFQCEDCRATGAIKVTAPLAQLVRESHQKQREEEDKTVQPGRYTTASQKKGDAMVYIACGVAFTKKDCPACGPDRVLPESPKPS